MQIFARDNHFEFIQRVGYEERKIAIKKLKQRERTRFDWNKQNYCYYEFYYKIV